MSDSTSRTHTEKSANAQVLLRLRDMDVVQVTGGVQISIGAPHDFRSETLDDAEAMRLAGLLWLAAQEQS